MAAGYYRGYPIFLSDRNEKKYFALVPVGQRTHKIYFGDTSYQQYHDKIGRYKHLDHWDKKRRKKYHARHNKNYGVGTADWFSKNILW